jgi:PBSX family phage terminase large subunit
LKEKDDIEDVKGFAGETEPEIRGPDSAGEDSAGTPETPDAENDSGADVAPGAGDSRGPDAGPSEGELNVRWRPPRKFVYDRLGNKIPVRGKFQKIPPGGLEEDVAFEVFDSVEGKLGKIPTMEERKERVDAEVRRALSENAWHYTATVTEQVVEKLLTAFAFGCTEPEACAYADVNQGTLHGWMERNPLFSEKKVARLNYPVIFARRTLVNRIRGDAKTPGDAYLALRYLAAKRPKEFGPKAGEDDDVGARGGYSDIPARLVGPQFADFFRDVEAHRHTHYYEPGGRGAGRSSAISLALADLMMKRRDVNALICREVGNTLRDSVFAQMCWAIEELGLEDEFTASKSKLEIERGATGQKMYFRGLDEPGKLKSIKPRKGYIGLFWLEEADQASGEQILRSIRQSIMRGGEDFWMFESWNTPRDKNHWINRRLIEAAKREDVRVHHSTYLQTPREWLGEPFFREADALRKSDPDAYRHEYLGEATGWGGEVFRNLSLERLSDETVSRFDDLRYGIDWGFTLDAFAFVKSHYDRRRRTLFVFEEFTGHGLTDDLLEAELERRGMKRAGNPIFADSADPKSIANFRKRGFYMLGCTKFNGSVEHGVKFMQNLRLIVIDPARCPVAAREFSSYSLKRDRTGEYMNVIARENDHTIDAARYSLNTEICDFGAAKSQAYTAQ